MTIYKNFFQFIAVAIPFISIYAYVGIINSINFSKRSLIIFSIGFYISSFIFSLISMEIFFPSNGDVLMSIFYIIFVMAFGFPFAEYYFFKRWINDNELFHKITHPPLSDDLIAYHPSPRKIIIIGLVSRYSMLTCCFIFIMVFIVAAIFDPDYSSFLIQYLIIILLGMFFFFIICMSFLRLLVKCPTCNLDIYKLDQYFSAYYDTAKHAVKDKIIECYSCHATYILDPNMDFEQAKVKAKEIAEFRKKRLQAIEDLTSGKKK